MKQKSTKKSKVPDDIITFKFDPWLLGMIDLDKSPTANDDIGTPMQFCLPVLSVKEIEPRLRSLLDGRDDLAKAVLSEIEAAFYAGASAALEMLRMNSKTAGQFLNQKGKKTVVSGSYTKAAMERDSSKSWQESYELSCQGGSVPYNSKTGKLASLDAYRMGVKRELKRKAATEH